ncbi:MAG: crotonase/enoyl-CoA hydratase family protein [Desulfobacteraceae bacterium]|jgi:enoyl-CoA hydratase
MQSFETIALTMDGAVARVDLNRPDKANSLNQAMWRELRQVFEELDQTKAVRAIVLGGAGKHFSTGIDLTYLAAIKEKLQQLTEGRKQEYLKHLIIDLQDAANAIERCRKPVLAAIQGFCMGAGVDIAAACDMRYATGATRFSVKEVDLAIVADVGTLQRLPRIVGEGIARELCFTGRTFKGDEARSMGFVNQLYTNSEELIAGVLKQAHQLAEKSPLTLRGIKETMNYSRDHTVAEGLHYVALRNAAMLLSIDLEEAVAAFMERRLPKYED